jgi:hypothetical protein
LKETYIRPTLSEFGRAYELTTGSSGANPDFLVGGIIRNPANPNCTIPDHPSLSCVAVPL